MQRQRTIAEKLVSDVIYHAKRKRLMDNSEFNLNNVIHQEQNEGDIMSTQSTNTNIQDLSPFLNFRYYLI